MYKRRKGISLAELVAVAAVIGLVGLVTTRILGIGLKFEDESKIDSRIQTEFRETADITTEIIRQASSVFIMPESSFNRQNIETGNYLEKDWNYIGVLETADGRSQIVQYTYDGNIGDHREKVLVEAAEGYNFDLQFIQPSLDNNSRLMEFDLKAYKVDNPDKFVGTDTKVEALNAIQVVNWASVDSLDPGKAIAYRETDRVYGEEGDGIGSARVVFIVDCSGSMRTILSGGESRMEALRRVATDLVEKFSEAKQIELAIIPYSMNANYSMKSSMNNAVDQHYRTLYGATARDYSFINVSERASDFKAFIAALVPTYQTNTGDGIRRAYYLLKETAEQEGPVDLEYVILLTDGDYTNATVKYELAHTNADKDYKSENFYLGPGDSFQGQSSAWAGNNRHVVKEMGTTGEYASDFTAPSNPQKYVTTGGGSVTEHAGRKYCKATGELLASRKSVDTYIIGLSDSVSTQVLLNLKEYTKAKKLYSAKNAEELEIIFDDIGEEIMMETWHVFGPKRQP